MSSEDKKNPDDAKIDKVVPLTKEETENVAGGTTASSIPAGAQAPMSQPGQNPG